MLSCNAVWDAATHVETSSAGAFAWLRLGQTLWWSWKITQPPSWFQSALSACFRRKKALLCISWAESRLPSALLLVPPAPQPAKRAVGGTQDWGTQYVAWTSHPLGQISTCVISSSEFVPSPGARFRPDHFSSLPTWFCVDLSYSLDCTGFFLLVSS